MSDRDSLTPRVFLVRHGETEWAMSGRYTGTTDIDLTPKGEAQISLTAATLVGAGKLLDPSRLTRIFVSPRRRAKRTFELLLPSPSTAEVTHTEDIAEWNYGKYEGLKTEEIIETRKKSGLDQKQSWDIWRDGCEGGESMKQVSKRLDQVISQIRDIQRPHMNLGAAADVVLVAHGLVLRCFMKRWLGFPVDFPLQMMLAPGAIAVLSYKNNNVDEPAFHAGLALPFSEDSKRNELEC